MRTIKLAALALTILVVLSFSAGSAVAQECSDITTFSPTQGTAGTTVSVAGSGAYPNQDVVISWDSTQIATIPADGSGDFSGTFMVPAAAMVGDHTVTVSIPSEGPAVDCPFTFTVVSAEADTGVTPDAYPAATTVLPTTGQFLLPALGMLAAGAGLLLARRRKLQ